jgi:hypothetical protein
MDSAMPLTATIMDSAMPPTATIMDPPYHWEGWETKSPPTSNTSPADGGGRNRKQCSVGNCANSAQRKGLCDRHGGTQERPAKKVRFGHFTFGSPSHNPLSVVLLITCILSSAHMHFVF